MFCVLNAWFSSNCEICADNYNYSRFTLKDKFRSEKCEVYLYGHMTIIRYLPRQLQLSRFKLKDKCRSEKWEVFLYGDMIIKVMVSIRAQNCGVLRSCSSWLDGMS